MRPEESWLRPSAIVILGLCITLSGCHHGEMKEENGPSAESVTGSARASVVLGPEDADHLWVFAESKDALGSGGEFHIYVDPERFPEASASFAKFGLGVGGSLPVHRHDKTEEIGYFLSGEGTVTVYEEDSATEIPVSAGYVVYIPPGSWHTIKNTGQEPFTLVFATIPNEEKGLLSFFRRIGAKPGEEATPVSADDFARLAAEHDLILRPPAADE